MENSFQNILSESKSILILLPNKPYFDQVAAGLSLFLVLRSQKEAQIYSSTPMVVEFNRLIGVNKVSQELGNKNLVIGFTDYDANNIERVSYDIDNGQFKLTVIPKERVTPPQNSQINISYSGISADTVILVGGANESHFPVLANPELSGAKLVHIGIKDLHLSGKNLISLARPASSVSELVAQLINEAGLPLDEDSATNLLSGIEVGSQTFSSPDTTAETFAMFAALLKAGGRRNAHKPARTDFEQRSQPGGFQPGMMASPRPAVQTPKAQPVQDPQTQVQNQPDAEPEVVDEKNAPKDWFEPKIYKGTSVK